MPSRLLIVILVASGAFCCPFNCLYHQADSAAYFAAEIDAFVSDTDALAPISPPRDQNESGCICRGAIFIAAPTLTMDLDAWFPLDLVLSLDSESAQIARPDGFYVATDLTWRPPLSGRSLCALHSSFLI